jgi:hypothetical protein
MLHIRLHMLIDTGSNVDAIVTLVILPLPLQ